MDPAVIARRSERLREMAAAMALRFRRSFVGRGVQVLVALARRALVERGKTVRAVLVRDAIRIELRALALEDGWLGDRVRLRNPMNRSIVHGEVLESGEVRLEL